MPQFTEEDARRIFARAAEHERSTGDAAPGFSADELAEIGRAAGLSPESVALAIAEVEAGRTDAAEEDTFWGVPTTVRRSRVLPAPMSDPLWEQMVSRLRDAFDTRGVATDVGRTREWTGTVMGLSRSDVVVTARPVEGGTRVTMETSRDWEARQTRQLAFWLPGGLLALFALVGIAEGAFAEPRYWIVLAAVASLGLIIPLISRAVYARWSRRRGREFDALMDQLELAARSADPSAEAASSTLAGPLPDAEPAERPALDLDALADAPDAEANATRSRTRT